MATLVKYAIRTASEWAANQSAMEAIYGVDGYYTTISLWADDFPTSFITDDEYWLAEPYADWPAGLNDIVDFPSRSSDATRTAEITPLESERHVGILGTGFYIKASKIFGSVFDISSIQHVKISYLSIENTASSSAHGVNSSIYGQVYSCIIKTATTGITINQLGNIYNTISIAGSVCFSPDINTEIYNSVAIGNSSSVGFNAPVSPIKLVNNVSYNNSSDFAGSIHADSSNNATSLAILDVGLGIVVDVASTDFEDTGIDDYHLSPISILIEEGLNLITSGDLSSPQYDIDYEQWPDSGIWDIGADYKAGGVSNPIAVNDAYDIIDGVQKVVSAPGILDNDTKVCN